MTFRGTNAKEMILATIEDFKNERGYAPTVREIGHLTHYSPSAVQYHLDAMERDGILSRDRNIARSIQTL